MTINGAAGGSLITLNNGLGNYEAFVRNDTSPVTLNLSDVTLTGGEQDAGGAITLSGIGNSGGAISLKDNSSGGSGDAIWSGSPAKIDRVSSRRL